MHPLPLDTCCMHNWFIATRRGCSKGGSGGVLVTLWWILPVFHLILCACFLYSFCKCGHRLISPHIPCSCFSLIVCWAELGIAFEWCGVQFLWFIQLIYFLCTYINTPWINTDIFQPNPSVKKLCARMHEPLNKLYIKSTWQESVFVKWAPALTDVVPVMECVAVGQARYSQVSLSTQTIQHILDKVLPLCQGQENLHVVCHTHKNNTWTLWKRTFSEAVLHASITVLACRQWVEVLGVTVPKVGAQQCWVTWADDPLILLLPYGRILGCVPRYLWHCLWGDTLSWGGPTAGWSGMGLGLVCHLAHPWCLAASASV